MRMDSPDYVLFDPYQLLESCPEADLTPAPNYRLYVVDQSPCYELIPLPPLPHNSSNSACAKTYNGVAAVAVATNNHSNDNSNEQ